MASSDPWTIKTTTGGVMIEYPGGFSRELTLAQAKRYFEQGLTVCSTSSSKTATATKRGAKSAKKPMKKGTKGC